MKCLDYFLQRLHHLSDTLVELKERVRDAVASELSRVVAQTVQGVVHAFILGQPQPAQRVHEPERHHWQDDDPDPWQEDDQDENDRYTTQQSQPIPEEPDPEPDPTPNDRWKRAYTLGATVLCWVLGQRWKPLIGIGVASLLGTAAGCGGPIFHVGSRVVLSAAELIAFGTSHTLR
jgi:hypothetical protein